MSGQVRRLDANRAGQGAFGYLVRGSNIDQNGFRLLQELEGGGLVNLAGLGAEAESAEQQ